MAARTRTDSRQELTGCQASERQLTAGPATPPSWQRNRTVRTGAAACAPGASEVDDAASDRSPAHPRAGVATGRAAAPTTRRALCRLRSDITLREVARKLDRKRACCVGRSARRGGAALGDKQNETGQRPALNHEAEILLRMPGGERSEALDKAAGPGAVAVMDVPTAVKDRRAVSSVISQPTRPRKERVERTNGRRPVASRKRSAGLLQLGIVPWRTAPGSGLQPLSASTPNPPATLVAVKSWCAGSVDAVRRPGRAPALVSQAVAPVPNQPRPSWVWKEPANVTQRHSVGSRAAGPATIVDLASFITTRQLGIR